MPVLLEDFASHPLDVLDVGEVAGMDRGRSPGPLDLILEFVFFFTFALNQWLQYRGVGRWRDYLHGEKVYLVLSLVAKSYLAWQIYGGSLAE